MCVCRTGSWAVRAVTAQTTIVSDTHRSNSDNNAAITLPVQSQNSLGTVFVPSCWSLRFPRWPTHTGAPACAATRGAPRLFLFLAVERIYSRPAYQCTLSIRFSVRPPRPPKPPLLHRFYQRRIQWVLVSLRPVQGCTAVESDRESNDR